MASRVLIVEDEPDIRELLAFHVERDGFHVSKGNSGADALRQVRTSPPDLVLLDLLAAEAQQGTKLLRVVELNPIPPVPPSPVML